MAESPFSPVPTDKCEQGRDQQARDLVVQVLPNGLQDFVHEFSESLSSIIIREDNVAHLFLIAHKASNDRRYIIPFANTGDAEIGSPRSFSASTSNSRSALMTVT